MYERRIDSVTADSMDQKQIVQLYDLDIDLLCAMFS